MQCLIAPMLQYRKVNAAKQMMKSQPLPMAHTVITTTRQELHYTDHHDKAGTALYWPPSVPTLA